MVLAFPWRDPRVLGWLIAIMSLTASLYLFQFLTMAAQAMFFLAALLCIAFVVQYWIRRNDFPRDWRAETLHSLLAIVINIMLIIPIAVSLASDQRVMPIVYIAVFGASMIYVIQITLKKLKHPAWRIAFFPIYWLGLTACNVLVQW